jgi:hypothetical protein
MVDLGALATLNSSFQGTAQVSQQSLWTVLLLSQAALDIVHRDGEARCCLQIGYAGRKGSTPLGWEWMDLPLADTTSSGLFRTSGDRARH